MHYAVVQRILGVLVVMFSASMLPPIAVSLWYDDNELQPFLLTLLMTLGAGLLLWFPVWNARSELRNRDGFIVVAMFWIGISLLSSLPFMLGPHLSFIDSLFESVSAFTTTGATTLIGLDEMPPSILYYRQQMQWLGGMGVMVLAVAILPMLGVGGMQLYRAETPGPMNDEKLTPRLMHTARTLWLIYLALTVACATAYGLAGMSLFDAVAHSFSTVSTGGFSPHDASLAYFNSPTIEVIAEVFMVLGGINFGVHFMAWRAREFPKMFADGKYPPNTLLIIDRLVQEQFLLEVQTIAAA